MNNVAVLNISDGHTWKKAVVKDDKYIPYFSSGKRNIIKEFDVINIEQYEHLSNGTIVIQKFVRPPSIQVDNLRIGSPVCIDSQDIHVRDSSSKQVTNEYSFLFEDDDDELMRQADMLIDTTSLGDKPGLITQILDQQSQNREIK